MAVELRDVSRTFPGGVRAVERMDLDIATGEFVALLGPAIYWLNVRVRSIKFS